MLTDLWVPLGNSIGLTLIIILLTWVMKSKKVLSIHYLLSALLGIVLGLVVIIGGLIIRAHLTAEYAVLALLWFACYAYFLAVLRDIDQYKSTVEPAKDVKLAKQKVFQYGGLGILVSVVTLIWNLTCILDIITGRSG